MVYDRGKDQAIYFDGEKVAISVYTYEIDKNTNSRTQNRDSDHEE